MSAISVVENQSVVLRNIRWETFLALLEDLGESRGRIAYDRGTLEIMSPTIKHETLKKLIGRLVETFTLELQIKIRSASSTTLISTLKKKGVEPDECYYVQNEEAVRGKDEIDLEYDPPPDLAIEIDITSSSIKRRNIYAALGIPEVWTHDGAALTVRKLLKNGEYKISTKSEAFPMLPVKDLVRFLDQRSALDETSLVRAFQAWVRKRFKTQ